MHKCTLLCCESVIVFNNRQAEINVKFIIRFISKDKHVILGWKELYN